ncbi:paraquat-inducible protein A [Tateyamaria sp. SN6-1]|uniref:paraquat-inducible protein A n=1 Tax=Tateyamaria sp. SN6-1 TaxID=3092148 RepID=UPI0039F55EBD
MASSEPKDIVTARAAGLVGCRRCASAWPAGTARCNTCGSKIASRDTLSLQKVWAWWIAGLMCYVPANVYPMLRTRTLFTTEEATIVGGAIDLIHYGAIGIALIILIASVAIPVAKFIAIAYLAITVRRGRQPEGHRRQVLYEVIEYIGRWSMIDVFVVAILAALVQLGDAASISAGFASLAFALSVIFTMFSAQAFDSRLIWDQTAGPEGTAHAR